MSDHLRTQSAIAQWSDQAIRQADELSVLTRRLATVQIEAEALRVENADLRAAMSGRSERNAIDDLTSELAEAREANAAMQERLDALTAEWEAQSRKLMELSLENERLKAGDDTEPPPAPPGDRQPKPVREPIFRECRACKARFQVDTHNKFYCSAKCAPLLRHAQARKESEK